jgi:hypothetical protein
VRFRAQLPQLAFGHAVKLQHLENVQLPMGELLRPDPMTCAHVGVCNLVERACHQSGYGRGVALAEQLAVANIATDHDNAPMAGLGHDAAFARPRGRGRRRQTGAQTVASQALGIQSRRGGAPFDHDRDPFATQTLGEDLAVAV